MSKLEQAEPAKAAKQPESMRLQEANHPDNNKLGVNSHPDAGPKTPEHPAGVPRGSVQPDGSLEFGPAVSQTRTNSADGSRIEAKDKGGHVVGREQDNKDGSGWAQSFNKNGSHLNEWNADGSQMKSTDFDKEGKQIGKTETDLNKNGTRNHELRTNQNGSTSDTTFQKDGTKVQRDKDAQGNLRGIETKRPDGSGESDAFNNGTISYKNEWKDGGKSGTLREYQGGKPVTAGAYQETPGGR